MPAFLTDSTAILHKSVDQYQVHLFATSVLILYAYAINLQPHASNISKVKL